MTRLYALLIADDASRAARVGDWLYSLSRSAGIMLGPLLAGIVVQVGSGPLSGTHGYAPTWLIAAIAILGSLRLLGGVGRRSSEG